MSWDIADRFGFDAAMVYAAHQFDKELRRAEEHKRHRESFNIIADFVYMQDKYGQTYGWGVAKYSTPEAQLGHDCVTAAYGREPARSWERIAEHMQSVLPDVPAEKLQAIFAVRSHLAA